MPDAYATAVLADSPWGYWRQDASSGTTESDQSGSTNNATYIGAGHYTQNQASLLPGTSDASAKFDGSSGGETIAANPFPGGTTTAVSIEAWITIAGNTSDGTGLGYVIGHEAGASAPFGLMALRVANGTPYVVSFFFNDGTNFFSVTANLTVSTTYHLVGTYDGTTGSLYVNGSLASSAAHAGTAGVATADWSIGTWPATPGQRGFNGTIDETAIYTTVLSPTRVAAHYTAGIAGPAYVPPQYRRSFVPQVRASNWRQKLSGLIAPEHTFPDIRLAGG